MRCFLEIVWLDSAPNILKESREVVWQIFERFPKLAQVVAVSQLLGEHTDDQGDPKEDSLGFRGNLGNKLVGFRLLKFLNFPKTLVFAELVTHKGSDIVFGQLLQLPREFRTFLLHLENGMTLGKEGGTETGSLPNAIPEKSAHEPLL